MQLVRDLERIGDYAEELGEIAIKLFPYPQHSSLPEIAIMSQHAQAMLATCLVALADLDETSGQRMKHLDDAVDNAYEHLYQTFAQQENISGVIEPILLLTLAIRCLERMADHATNIAQRVTYIVTGQRS
jgi:phosphate transport system protein